MKQEKNHAIESFESRLRDEMKRFGLESAADLAKFAEVAWSTANQWLAGSIPRKLALFDLASRLEVTASWLETGLGEKEPVNLKDVQAHTNRGYVISDHSNMVREDETPYGSKPIYLGEIIKLAESADLSSILDTMETLSQSAAAGNRDASATIAQMIPIVRKRIDALPKQNQSQ